MNNTSEDTRIISDNLSTRMVQKCPICETNNSDVLFNIQDYSISKAYFEIAKCKTCDLIFTANPPKEEDIAPYYISTDYVSHSNTTKGLFFKLYHIGRSFMLSKKHKLIQKYIKTGKILDIGAGTGYFLNHMIGKGFEAYGVEVSPDARAFAQTNFGLTLQHPTDYLNSSSIEKKYDVVSLWHVLEHLYQPNVFLDRIHQELHDEGILLIALPNVKSSDSEKYQTHWAGFDLPRHLWHFSPSSVEKLALKHNFTLIEKKQMPLDPFYVSILSEKTFESDASTLRGVWTGLKAYWAGQKDVNKATSIIYIFKKNR